MHGPGHSDGRFDAAPDIDHRHPKAARVDGICQFCFRMISSYLSVLRCYGYVMLCLLIVHQLN